MATLASQIDARLQVVVAAEALIDLTNQRDDDTALNATILTAVATDAAAEVQGYLGSSVDSSDALAVVYGNKLALLLLSTHYAKVLTEAGLAYTAGVYSALEKERERRMQAQDNIVHSEEDFDAEDARYTETSWDKDG